MHAIEKRAEYRKHRRLVARFFRVHRIRTTAESIGCLASEPSFVRLAAKDAGVEIKIEEVRS
jgi:hypothetical protein